MDFPEWVDWRDSSHANSSQDALRLDDDDDNQEYDRVSKKNGNIL